MIEEDTANAADKSRSVSLTEDPTKSRDRRIAELAVSPAMTAATVAVDFSRGTFGDVSMNDAVSVLGQKIADVVDGNVRETEAFLMAQAVALNSIFVDLARRSVAHVDRHPDSADRYLRLALKAQSQCRTTLETLATIKNPPIVYARQANVTTGPQQVNNGIVAPTRTREIESQQNQLSRGTNELLPDARASRHASRTDSPLETLGKVDRAEVPRG